MPEPCVAPWTMSVSSAPHTLPFAYTTCCMRESFGASLRGRVVVEGGPSTSAAHAAIVMQSPNGVLPAFCAGSLVGTAYGCTGSGTTDSTRLAGDVSMALVFDTDQSQISL